MAKALDSGKAFIDGILAKLPESLRESAKAAFTAPEATDAITAIGDGVLARADYSRAMDDIKTKEAQITEDYQNLNKWFETNKGKLEEYDTLKASRGNGGDPPKPGATIDTSKFVDRDAFEEALRERDFQAANYLGAQTKLVVNHLRDFNETLDMQHLLTKYKPQFGKQAPDGHVFGIQDAYNTEFADKLAERDKTREAERIKKLVDEQVADRMKTMPANAFPIKGGSSPLDVLDPTSQQKPEEFTADSATALYQRLQESRQSA